MLQETSDNASDTNPLGKPRHARKQSADAAHDNIDLDATLRGAVQERDELGIGDLIRLDPDRCRPPSRSMCDFGLDELDKLSPQAERGSYNFV